MCALFSSQSFATKVNTNPMEKVIELMAVIGKQIAVEGKEDQGLYNAIRDAYGIEQPKIAAIIKHNEDKIEQLQTDLDEAQAWRDGKKIEFVDMKNKQVKQNTELTNGKKERKKERDEFEKNELTYIDSLHQLGLAIDTLNKKDPFAGASASASSASLLSVADNLKKTLMHNADLPLGIADRDTLDAFVRTVRVSAWHPPSFLQYGSHGPYGAFQKTSGGLLGTLQTLLGKVEKERDAAGKDEQKALVDFKAFRTGLEAVLEDISVALANMETSVAQSQMKSSKQKVSLLESQQIFKEETLHMKELEKDFREKTWAYKVRLGKRSDEAIAIHEAQRILTSEVAKKFIKAQSIGSVSSSAASFIHSKEQAALRRKAVHVLKHATTPGLALLVLKSSAHLKSANPFNKVKSMVKGMLDKLMDQQAKESTHAAFCDREKHMTAKKTERKEDQVAKMESRLEALAADLDETKADIVTAGKDLVEVTNATAAAVALYSTEKKAMETAVKEYKDAANLTKRGLKVLRAYYRKEQGGSSADTNAMKQRYAMGNGVVSILEVAVEDFESLYATAKADAEAAATDYKEMQQASAVRSAVFKKDLELKSATKIEQESDQMDMSNDLKMYKSELKTLGSYSEKLAASCMHKGPSYVERKAKRDSEMQSLKEALTIISEE